MDMWSAELAADEPALLRRLSSLCRLNEEEECAVLRELGPPQQLRRGEEVVTEGAHISVVHIMSSGMACRYRILGNGQRQIISLLLPGDIIDFSSPVSDIADHSVSTLTRCEVVCIRLDLLRSLVTSYPNLRTALWRYSLSQGSIFQSWLINLRRRNAAERLAHLLCEQFIRLKRIGLTDDSCPFGLPIAQSDLADATAMSSVHVNRTLQSMRDRRLIGRNPALVEILDWDGLCELAEFDPAYLSG